jgi:glycosyltransferase involved in cell wall biosynthesis
MISIITPTYNTDPDVLSRTWKSIKSQSYIDWEWVIYDDSFDKSVQNQVYGFCSDERYKIRYFKPHISSNGNIGYVKRMAFGLGLGDILLELDHDDELTSDCLSEVQKAFDENHDVGFVYSDWCEILQNNESGRYPDGWAFGYGSHYWDDQYKVWVMSSPEINRKTTSHIVSMPNHVRAWRSSLYHYLTGHNSSLNLADDYELMIRTILITKYFHIKKLLYKQYVGPHTANQQRNWLIQSLVPEIHSNFKVLLDEKFGKLD